MKETVDFNRGDKSDQQTASKDNKTKATPADNTVNDNTLSRMMGLDTEHMYARKRLTNEYLGMSLRTSKYLQPDQSCSETFELYFLSCNHLR